MDKQGWQVTAGVMAIAVVGLGFALMATRGVLAQERNDRQPCDVSEPETIVVRETAPATVIQGLPIPDAVSCSGGVYLIRTEHGIESLLKNGQALHCTP